MAERRIQKAPLGVSTFGLQPGEWKPILVSDQSVGGRRRSARMACPGCGTTGTLQDHGIDDEGRVTPSVDCTQCEYHESGVVLEGWNDA